MMYSNVVIHSRAPILCFNVFKYRVTIRVDTIQHGDSTLDDSTSGIFCVIIPSVDLLDACLHL